MSVSPTAVPASTPDVAGTVSSDPAADDQILQLIYQDQRLFHGVAGEHLGDIVGLLKAISSNLANLLRIANVFYVVLIVIPAILAAIVVALALVMFLIQAIAMG